MTGWTCWCDGGSGCCVLGVNGAEKSTLLRLVVGAGSPDAGSVVLGGSVKLGYFAQHAMDLLDGERTELARAFQYRYGLARPGHLFPQHAATGGPDRPARELGITVTTAMLPCRARRRAL